MNLIQHFIDGKVYAGSSNKKGKIFNPATGKQESEVILGSKSDLDLAVEKAKIAFETWSNVPAIQRARIIFKFNKINYAQPIIPINYSSYRIPIKLPVLGLYSANTAQIYPEDRGTNYSVDLGQKVTNIILEDENGFIKR